MCHGRYKKTELYVTSVGYLCKACYAIHKAGFLEGWEHTKVGMSERELRVIQMQTPNEKEYTLETDATDAEIHERYPQDKVLKVQVLRPQYAVKGE